MQTENIKNIPIAIFGGTGHYGRKITEKLLAKGQPVRVLTRDAAAAAAKIPGNNVEWIEGDAGDPVAIETTLKGASGIVIALSAASPKQLRRMREIEHDAVIEIMEEACRQGIDRLVYLSGYEIREAVLDDLHMASFGNIKLEVERKIAQSGMNWTILGCSPSFDLFFTFLRGDKLIVPGGGYRPVPTISPDDVGEIAARAVLRNDLSGRRFRMTGPEAVSFPEFARRVSEFRGRKIKHGAIPLPVLNVVSALAKPFFPFLRFIYFSVNLLNHFPSDLAEQVPQDHRLLEETFGYAPESIDKAIARRLSPIVTG